MTRLWRAFVGSLVCTASARASPTGMLHIIAPPATDSRLTDNDANNYAFIPAGASKHATLLVFIGGSNAPMNDFAAPFLARAAHFGYRIVGVDYRYNPPGTELCEVQGSLDCFSRYRRQKVFGIGHMPEIDVTPAESLVNRLIALLAELHRRYPGEGWGQYIKAGQPDWPSIALTGFSQGAGLAAYLAKAVGAARVILLSSPWDHYDETGMLAPWLSGPSATPAARWFGLYAAGEHNAEWLGRAYAALGIPAGHVHVLCGDPREWPRPGKDSFHWSVIGRAMTPRDGKGGFVYQPDWDFALSAPTE